MSVRKEQILFLVAVLIAAWLGMTFEVGRKPKKLRPRPGGSVKIVARDSILADALEALIGAIVIDGGEDACRDVVLKWFADRMEQISPQSVRKDAKTRLQEWLQARKHELPAYEVLSVTGQAPKQTFEVACSLPDLSRQFTASGASRRRAEQQAAEQALDWLEQSA